MTWTVWRYLISCLRKYFYSQESFKTIYLYFMTQFYWISENDCMAVLNSWFWLVSCMFECCGGKSKRQTQWVWCQASERLLFNRNNTNKVSKGENSVQNKPGIWCPRRAAGFVKEGQCSGRKGPGKGRSPAAARAPLWGPGCEGRWLLQRLRLPLDPRRSTGLVGPASWGRHRVGIGSSSSRLWLHGSLSTLPTWTHEDTSAHARGINRSPEERRSRHITAPDLAVSTPLLSLTHTHTHTHTPVGSLVKGGD